MADVSLGTGTHTDSAVAAETYTYGIFSHNQGGFGPGDLIDTALGRFITTIMPLNTTWGSEAKTQDPLHLTSAPRPMVLDSNRKTDSHRDFVCDDDTKTGVFNLDCGLPPSPPPPPPPPPVTGPGSLAASVKSPALGPSAIAASVVAPASGPSSLTATAKSEFNISPYLGNSYDTEAEIFALQATASDGLVAYNESTHTLYIWVAAQGVCFQIHMGI